MSSVDTSTPMLVIALNHEPLRHRALPLARSAGRMGVEVHAVRSGEWTPAALSRYLAGGLVVPHKASAEAWVENLLRIGRRLGRVVLVPIDDAAAVLVEDHADALSECFLFQRQEPGVTRTLGSKRELHELCLRLGVPSPHAAFPRSRAEVARLSAEFGFPVVAKRIDGWLPCTKERAPSVYIARDLDDLLDVYDGMESPDEPNVMLQEYVPGPPSSVWMFNGCFGSDSRPLVTFTGRKLRQYPPYTGSTTLGACDVNADVDGSARRLMADVRYHGIVDLGMRYDERDGQYKLLDVNPRIGSTFRLFVSDEGMDVLRALYLDLTGQPVPPSSPPNGRRWVVEPLDVLSSAHYWRDGELSPMSWLRSFAGVSEAAWWAADDPLPALAAGLLMATYSGGRLLRQRRARKRGG